MVFLILLFIYIQELRASEEWWTTSRSEDKDYYYYVSSSEGDESITFLQQKAFNKALAELIREHFGMGIQINENSVELLNQEEYQIVTKQSSDPIFLKGLSLLRTLEKDGEEKRVFVQLRADKKLLEESIKIKPKMNTFNIYGDNHGAKIDYKIKTIPQGALIHFVHLDRKFSLQGQGDALFNLPPGRYEMVVSLAGYKIVNKAMTLFASGREELLNLEKLVGVYIPNLTPSNASVELNGEVIQKKKMKLAVGIRNILRYEHPDYFPIEKEVTLEAPDSFEESIVLNPRPSTLYFQVKPTNASIEVDGKIIQHRRGKFEVNMGTRNIVISSPGFISYRETLNIVPNRDYPLKIVNLVFDDKSVPPSQKGTSLRIEYNPFMTFGHDSLFMFYPLGFHVEYHYISLGFGFNFVNSKETNEEMQQDEESRLEDKYLTLRLISPMIRDVKMYGSWTYGEYKHKKLVDGTTLWKKNTQYNGFGGGVRAYMTPKVSVHGEYFQVQSDVSEVESKKKENRIIFGVAYEF
jgi:hypothetical protein